MKLIALLAVAAFVAFASSAVVTPRDDDRGVEKSTIQPSYITSVPDDDYHGDAVDNKIVIDGVAIKYLSKEELNEYLDEKDEELIVDIDTAIFKKIVEQRIKNNKKTHSDVGTSRRKKRAAPIVFAIVRGILQASVRGGRTFSGSRVTQHYTNPSSYQSMVNQFNKLPIDNRNTFLGQNGISGHTGTLGRYKITIRDGSTEGRPTLDIRSPTLVRKFRLDGN